MDWRTLDLRINDCGSVYCEPEWSWRSRLLDDFDLWFVWRGRGTLDRGGDRVDISVGSAFCLEPGTQCDADQDPDHRLGVCYLHFDFVDRHGQVVRLPRGAGPPATGRLTESDLHERLLKQAVALHHGGRPTEQAAARRYLQATLLDLAAAAEAPERSARERAGDELVRDAARHVRERPGDSFSVEALAARAGYTADHFTRLFRAAMGVSPKEFCVRVRVERARMLLRESDLPVARVAAALGYADVFFFSRQFKQRTGVSPSAWRAGLVPSPGTPGEG